VAVVTYQTEKLADVKPELGVLWPEYWNEVRGAQEAKTLNPNYSIYEHFEREEKLLIITVREGNSRELIGFHISIISPHLNHADVLCSFGNAWYVKPEYRRGTVGFRLLREAEALLKQRGVIRMYMEITPQVDVSALLKRRGWAEATRQYCKEFA